MFSLIPKTDAGLWLGPVGFSPPVALYPGTVRSELMGFFLFFVFFFVAPVLAGSVAVM